MICQSRRRRTFRFFSWMYHFWQQTQSGRRFYMCIPSLFITWNIKYTCVNSCPQPVQCCDVSSSVTEEAVVTLPVGPVAKIQLRIFFPLSGHAAILIHQVYYGFLDICPPRNMGRLKVFKELPHDYISKSTWTLQNCTLVWMMNI